MPGFFSVHIPLLCALLGMFPLIAGATQETSDTGTQVGTPSTTQEQPNDIIARVGDQPITLKEIEIMLNSTAMIGMNIPPPGTPERNQVRLTLLDKIISANLLYLDALDKGEDENPVYQHDVKQFAESTLATLYRQEVLIGDIPISDGEIMAFYDNNVNKAETPFTKDVGMAIEAKLRKQKYQSRLESLRERLREGIQVDIDMAQLEPAQDEDRDSAVVVARIDQAPVTWGEVRTVLVPMQDASTVESRAQALNDVIDQRIMLQKARAAGLENDSKFKKRLNEFRKVHLISMYRNRLVDRLDPTDDEVRAYYQEHLDRIAIPEARKVQMVVMTAKEDAEKVKQQIEAGEISIYEAARDYSIDPNARKTLGEMGWVSQGTGFPELDKLTFSLPQNEIGGPVQSPAGWNLVKVLEIRKPAFTDISRADTWRKTRHMMLKERVDGYTVNLRKDRYKVEVYNDVLNRLLEEEVGQKQDLPAVQQQGES